MTSKLRFGIIGCGVIGHIHAEAIATLPDAQLVAVVDTVLKPTQELMDEFHVTHYGNLQEMLAREQLDVVDVCTPSGMHGEHACQVMRAGVNVIVEKPMEVSRAAIEEMLRVQQETGVKLAVISQHRFDPDTIKVHDLVEAQAFGRLVLGNALIPWYRSQTYYDSGAWRGTWKLDGGGALMNQAIHSVDLLTWIMGPVVEVRAETATLAHERIEVEDTAVATLRFANGALGVIEASTAVYPGYLKRIEIHGSEGTAVLEEEDIKVWDFARKQKRDDAIHQRMQEHHSTGGGASDPTAIGHHGHARQFADVLDAIRRKRPPLIDAYEGRRSVEIITAIYKSANSGKSVRIEAVSK